MSANEREEDITVTDLSAEEAFEAGDCIFDEEQYNQPGQPRSFYEATMKQLGPLIQDCSCASLLRDTTISPDAGKALSHQLKFVHRKAIAVNKYCEFQLARLDDLDHIIHAVLARSKETPSKAVRTYVGSIRIRSFIWTLEKGRAFFNHGQDECSIWRQTNRSKRYEINRILCRVIESSAVEKSS